MIEGEDLESRPRPEHITLAEESTIVSRSKLPGRWVDAVDLRAGDVLFQRDRGQVPLISLGSLPERQPVYNFAVDDLHCYAVGTGQTLVHNNCGDDLVQLQFKYSDVAESATERMARLGKEGESAAGITGRKRAIDSISGTATRRFPDQLTRAALIEVKNVKRLRFTNQLRDFLYYSLEKEFDFTLVVRKSVDIHPDVQKVIDLGFIEVRQYL